MDWVNLAVAALIGLVVGIEREWSGHASGPHARFAGVRTFFLLGIIGGAAGLLIESNAEFTAGVLLAGGAALAVAAYLMAARRVPSPSRARPKPQRSRCWRSEPWPVPGQPSSPQRSLP
jgi:Uncharacterized membrane protein